MQDGSASSSGSDGNNGQSQESGFVATVRRVWAEGLRKVTKRKLEDDESQQTKEPEKSKKRRHRGQRDRSKEKDATSSTSSSTSSSSSATSTSSSSGGVQQALVEEARRSVSDKKRKIEELTAALLAPADTEKQPPRFPTPAKPKKKKNKKKSKRQRLESHSNTNSSHPSVDLVAAELKTKDLRDFLLWLYAIQGVPSPAVFFSNPTNLSTTVMVVLRSIGQNELIKHRDLLKNLRTQEEGGLFQKVSAFTAPGNKTRIFETVATLILTDLNTRTSASEAKEVEKEVAVFLQEQYQQLVQKLPDPTNRAILFEELVATQEERFGNKFPIYGVSKPEDFAGGSSAKLPPDLSKFVRLPKKLKQQEGAEPRKHLPIVAIDCEMCQTADGHELTRVSVLDDNYNVLYDQLVKPHKPIIDYLTRWSGITEEMLADVTTRLEDVHKAFYELGITRKTIIAGHSLENDLLALRLFHDRVIDTALHFPHANGPPFKNSLRYLTEKFLKRLIQQGRDGHCSVEDSKAVMELVLLRAVQAGVQVSKSGEVTVLEKDDGDNLFIKVRNANKKVTVVDRHAALQRYVPPQRTRGPADAFTPSPSKLARSGDGLLPTPPSPLPSSSSSSSSGGFVPPPNRLTTCACTTDDEIVERVVAHLGSDHRADLIFTQLHSFEDYFATHARRTSVTPDAAPGLLPTPSFEDQLVELDQRVGRIYEALPPNGLMMVVTGRGPIVDVFKLQREKKSAEVVWTPEKESALREAVDWARRGRTFWAVKPPVLDDEAAATKSESA